MNQILVESNLQLCQLIKQGQYCERELYKHFKKTAHTINELSKLIEQNSSSYASNNEPKCHEGAKQQYDDKSYNKLIARIEKIKQKVNKSAKMTKNGAK